MINEIEHDELLKFDIQELKSIEPWWKLILGNKALLPMLWEMFPYNQYLVPTYFDTPDKYFNKYIRRREYIEQPWINYDWVAKPLYGREGVGIFFSLDFTLRKDNWRKLYKKEKYARYFDIKDLFEKLKPIRNKNIHSNIQYVWQRYTKLPES